jgi:iron complex outermembrane recepter protein
LFAQVTAAINPTTDFTLRVAYANVYTPYAYGSPSQPVTRGPAIRPGATFQLFVPIQNPHAQAFAERTGFDQTPGYAFTSGFTPALYRAFAHGGLDTFAGGGNHSTPRKIDNRYWHIVSELTGEVFSGINYDLGITFNQSLTTNSNPDIAIYRLQEALNGFGGPNCNAPDLNPNRFGTQNPAMAGVGDCMWYNPFATNFAGQPVLGLANPQHDPDAQNNEDLIRWIFNDRYQENNTWTITTDLVFSGLLPGLELPGGPMGWAVGGQWRQQKFRQSVPDALYNGGQLCPWPNEFGQVPLPTDDPNYNGCTPDNPGPFQFFAINRPSSTDQRQYSVFGELNFPLLDSVNLTAALRHEKFEPAGLDATVYKFSGRWQATSNLALRGSYGTNYQAPGADIVPGNVTNAVASFTRAAGNWRGSQVVTRSDIEPEEATVWGVGAIWQSRGFTDDSRFQLIVDYFDIDVKNELGLVSTSNEIVNAVFSIHPTDPSLAPPNNGSALADCSNPLVDRITLDGGVCTQGVTNAGMFSSVRTEFGNGPGSQTAGFDIQSTYSFPVYAGLLSLGLNATRVTKYEVDDTVLDGFVVTPGADRLGNLNFAVVANAVSKWRSGLTVNYAQDVHNVRLRLNYVSGVTDERGPITPFGINPETGEAFEESTFGVDGKDWISADLHYVVDLPWFTLGASIVNITDRDPPVSRQELGYDPRIGSPLGRTYEISLKKSF